MAKFNTKEEYKRWIEGEEWYQTIHLPSGLTTAGKVPTHARGPLFDAIDFKGKTFLDIGCNSGQYCFLAKERGAKRAVGIDINGKRIAQARTLAENENYDVTFLEQGIFEVDTAEQFDIVFCLAVLTEISDIFGAIKKLTELIGERALIELDLAKPLLYVSYSKNWLKGYRGLSRQRALTEVRERNGGEFVVSPTFDVLCRAFGESFKLTRKEGGLRYDLVEVVRLAQ